MNCLAIFVLIASCFAFETEASIGSLIKEFERINSDAIGNNCGCVEYDCGCCQPMNLFFLNGTLCSNITYLPREIGMSFTLIYNEWTIINETLSARNPPPVCGQIYQLLPFEFCVRFYDIDMFQELRVCVDVEVRLLHRNVMKLDLGCVQFKEDKKLWGKYNNLFNWPVVKLV